MTRRSVAVAVVSILVSSAMPATASVFEIYVRGHGGYEYLDLSALDYSGLLAIDPANPDTIPTGYPSLEEYTKEYSGSGFAVGATAGILLLDFLAIGVDFRQAELDFGKDSGNMTDLTQLSLDAGFHFLGTEMIVDPSAVAGLGYCYLTTTIPGVGAGNTTQERTANGFIGRVGAALDVRFVSWMSAGIAADFSFLYFDGGGEQQAWGFNTDILGRLSVHI